jgi:type I restriction enzyme S subunit
MPQKRTVRLEEVAEVVGGGTPSRTVSSYFGGSISWATPTDVTALTGLYISSTKESITEAGLKNSSTKLMPAGVVLLTSRATICTNQGFVNFICGDDLAPAYLAYWLRTQRPKMLQHAGGTTFKEISRGSLRKFTISLPALPEQRRIVNLLLRAEGIVRLRREAQRKAAELTPALFLDIFGDPARNPKGWPVVNLGSFLSIRSSVKTPNLGDDADLPCVGADSIESGTGKIVSWPTVAEIRPISGKYSFTQGDVLYSKIRPALRKVVIAPSNGYCSADMYPLHPSDLATPEFVSSLLLSKDFTDYAVGVSMRAQMPKVNRQTLFAYEAPLPPIELQRKFAAKAGAVRSIATQQAISMAIAQATFDALLSGSFQH